MKNFRCVCGNTLYFENTQCLVCQRALGFLPEYRVLSPLEPVDNLTWRALAPVAANSQYRMCGNYRYQHVCNWMVPVSDPEPFCRSCRLNQVIPDLTQPNNHLLWSRIELAKRRLLFNLLSLGLPVHDKRQEPETGMAFQFLQSPESGSEFSDNVVPDQSVLTGHHNGVITINLSEADSTAREQMRERMNESYRTLLGHFHHESGHYFWGRLVANSQWLPKFRSLFGDETRDYQQSLNYYYSNGPQADWEQFYLSAYASSHPWEDWAETWAHYLHMTASLETANDLGFSVQGEAVHPLVPDEASTSADDDGPMRDSFHTLLMDWKRLAMAMNALNRSMGLADAYPFVLMALPAEKLFFIHRVIASARTGAGSPLPVT